MADRVLVDTSAFYALASTKDDFHSKAEAIYTRLIDQKSELFTTSYVFVETAALIQRRLGHEALERFAQAVQETFIMLWVDRRSHWEAWDMLRERGSRDLSFVDCTTIVLAKDMDATVFAFDEDFNQEGLTIVS